MPHERKLGYLTGPLMIDDDRERHDLHDSIWCGPTGVTRETVNVLSHEAKFILLVEKQSIFNRLVEDQFHRKNFCVLATGNGYPGRSFQTVIRTLYDQLQVPFYILADNDPPGYMFFFLIARGTARRFGKPNNETGIRDARYLGMRVEDYKRLGFAEDVRIPLSDAEIEILLRLKSCPWLRSSVAWQREFHSLMQAGYKIEIEATITRGLSFLAESYLPERIGAEDYLRLSS